MFRKLGILGRAGLLAILILTANRAPSISSQKSEVVFEAKKSKSSDALLICMQLETFVKAFQSKDVDLMMSLYAPGMISFDIIPPLQDKGKTGYKKVWEKTFAEFTDGIKIETRDLQIITSGNVGFTHELIQVHATTIKGLKVKFWERMTLCFSKVEGKWLIIHEHVSVPADLNSRKAMLDLKP